MSYRDFFRNFWETHPDWFKKFTYLPDLTFYDYDIDVSGNNVKLKVVIVNIGKSKSNPTFLYFNAIDTTPPPGKNEIRIQQVKDLPELAPRERHECRFQLTRQEIIDNQINRAEILIDPKNLVREINERNNKLRLG